MKQLSKTGVFTILLVSSLTIMVGSVIAPSLAEIVKHKDLSFSASWLITLPSLGVVLFAPLIGRLLQTLGSLKLLSLGLIPYAVFGVMGAYIDHDLILIADRILLGAATVAVQVSITAYIADFFRGEARMKMIAWQGMAIEFGGVVFLAIGGILGEINWQFPFFIYLIALACLILVFLTLPKPGQFTTDRTDVSNSDKKNRAKVILIFMASLLAMMLFFVGFVTFPLYLPQAFGFSESQTGYFMSFISVIAIAVASQMPVMVKKIGDAKTVSLGFLFFMLGYGMLAFASGLPFLVLTAVFVGTGFGFTIPLLNHMMVEASTLKNQGKNLGLFSMGVFGGQFLSTFIEYVSENYTAIYGFAVVLALLIGSFLYFMFLKISKN